MECSTIIQTWRDGDATNWDFNDMSCFAVFLLTLIADIDFSANEPGAVRDRINPKLNPGFVRTEDIYGRRFGDALDIDCRFEHPRYALGRDGKVSAIKSGNARNEVPGYSPVAITLPENCVLPTNGPSTQILWFNVYDTPVQSAHVRIAESCFGYQIGFRLDWVRAHWMPSGGIEFVYGDGKTSKSIKSYSKKDCPAGVWHQAAIVNDGREFEFFLDGVSLGKSSGCYLQGNRPLSVRLASFSDEVSFKTDSYKLYSRALTSEEIEKDWKDGTANIVSHKDELGAIRKLPQLKNSNSGIFSLGEKIDIVKDGKIIETFSYDKSGVYEKVFEGRHFPICIVPKCPVKTDIGAEELLNRQPELMALGIRKTLVKIPWNMVEPEKSAYDWTLIDVIDETCRKKNVEAVFVLSNPPEWYKKDSVRNAKSLEKIRAYAEARYEIKLAAEDDIGYVNASNAKKIKEDVNRLRIKGKEHIFFKTRPPEWLGHYAQPFEGRPNSAVLAIGQYLADE